MRGVALTQRKGGSGKTVLSHALALGASWHNIPAYLMHTDNREPLKVNGRPYMYYDAREPKTLQTLVDAAINADGLCIIDSAGNRPEFDEWIGRCCMIQLRREWGRFSNFSFRTPQRRISAYPARPSG